jgi:hypothetical protein
METFSPGDRVVAINTDMSGPICGPTDSAPHVFRFPFGSISRDVIYHVAAVGPSKDGNQALFLTGLRVMLDSREIGWNSSRFRKVDTLAGHAPTKRRRKQPVSTISAASISLNH